LTGQYFTGATEVDFCGDPMPYTVNSDSQITTSSPTTSYNGPCWITVTTPSGTSPQQNNVTFSSYQTGTPAPVVNSVNPSSVSGSNPTTVTLSGQYFSGATEVNFCGDPMPYTVISDTQITTSSPSTSYVGPCW